VNKKPHWTERLGNELPPWWEPEPEWITPWVKKKLESGERPPWEAGNEREQQWMMAWVLQKLDEADIETHRTNIKNVDRAFWTNHFATLRPQIAEAEHGNIEPLRKKFPLIARFINLPKLEDGKRRKSRKKFSRADAAARDVRRIRAIWQQNFDGKKNRKGQPTAEQIAMERWEDVTEEQLASAAKKLPGKKSR
jgi:hypothetical protein